MTFRVYLHVFSLALILTGFSAILITGGYALSVLGGITITLAYGVMGERLPQLLRIPRWFWNIVAIILFLYLLFDTFFGELDLVGNGIKFVIYLQIVKILSPKTNRDQIQIYLLSFLHILASTVLSDDISFSLPFLLYIILATWTLTLFNLKLQQEQGTHPRRRDLALKSLMRSKDIITPRFLAATSLLSISIISFTLVIFFMFPRLSMGKFFKRVGRRQHVSGFSEKVELGTIGNIRTNDTITLRAEFLKKEGQQIDEENLYWRGTSADFFDGKAWSKTFTDKKRVNVDPDTGMLTLRKPTLPGERLVRYQVFLEPLSTPLLFAVDKLYRVTWPSSIVDRFLRGILVLRADYYGGIHFASSTNFLSDLRYEAESIVGQPSLETLRSTPAAFPSWVENFFLQLPEMNSEVRRLLEGIPVPEVSLYDQVLAIQRFLEREYTYTLNVQDFGTQDPLSFFLLEEKHGHCEYFSTAFAMALRVHGIPARHVIGFRGGELNPYGDYIAVRQSDAHSWIEVFFPSFGWIRFDASPMASETNFRGAGFRRFHQIVDYLRLRWNKYIIEYDLRSQAMGLERIGRSMAKLLRRPGTTESDRSLEEDGLSGPSLLKKFSLGEMGLLTGLLALIIGLAMLRIHKRSQRRAVPGVYGEVLQLLAKSGHEREAPQTLVEFVEIVEKREGVLPPLQKLTHLYYQERYGGKKVPTKEWQALLQVLKRKLSNQAESKRPSPPSGSSRRAA